MARAIDMDGGVEILPRGYGLAYVIVDAWDRSTASEIASLYGRITQADIDRQGRFSFAVELNKYGESIVAETEQRSAADEYLDAMAESNADYRDDEDHPLTDEELTQLETDSAVLRLAIERRFLTDDQAAQLQLEVR